MARFKLNLKGGKIQEISETIKDSIEEQLEKGHADRTIVYHEPTFGTYKISLSDIESIVLA